MSASPEQRWPDCLECGRPLDPDAALAGEEFCASCAADLVEQGNDSYEPEDLG